MWRLANTAFTTLAPAEANAFDYQCVSCAHKAPTLLVQLLELRSDGVATVAGPVHPSARCVSNPSVADAPGRDPAANYPWFYPRR
jgi:hypothetical protein